MSNEIWIGEAARGCGHRQIGGLYMIGGDAFMSCDRLPCELVPCEVCGSELKFHRGFQWIDWNHFGKDHNQVLKENYELGILDCSCSEFCYVCHPKPDAKFGFMWVGEQYYTPGSFSKEAVERGVSKRISVIPNGLEIGSTKILLAHRKAVRNEKPGIFMGFVLKRIEKLIKESKATDEMIKELEEKGITPVIVKEDEIQVKK